VHETTLSIFGTEYIIEQNVSQTGRLVSPVMSHAANFRQARSQGGHAKAVWRDFQPDSSDRETLQAKRPSAGL